MNRRLLVIGGLVGVVIVAALGWYLVSPLFINDVVDEAFPIPSASELADMSEDEKAEIEAEVLDAAADMPDTVMDEAMPEGAGPVIVSVGEFVDADAFHQGTGTATIYQLEDGSHVLRFENFEVTNGPDLHVYLTNHADPQSQADVMQGAIDLGSLSGNVGNQNYEIPAGTDVSQFNTVVIYCQPFHVIFSTASLG